jgi:hypothetical protein
MTALLSASAEAQSLSLTLGADRIGGKGAPGSPLGTLPTPSGAYSLRKLVTAYAGKSMQIRRASDNAVLDIGFTVGGDFDTAAATTHCNATSCFIAKWYDQSGNARDFLQASTSAQPALFFGCLGGNACLRWSTISHNMLAASFTPATGLVSYSVVNGRTTGTSSCHVMTENGIANNDLALPSGSANYTLKGGITAPAADGQWHSVNAALQGATSYIMVDGTTKTGSVTGNTTVGQPQITSGGSATCDQVEAIFWDNYAMTAGQAAALNTNQHSYWGF